VVLDRHSAAGRGAPKGKLQLILPELHRIATPRVDDRLCGDVRHNIFLRKVEPIRLEKVLVAYVNILRLEECSNLGSLIFRIIEDGT